MPLAKTKIIEIDGARYQIRRMLPEVGSYLSMQLLGAAVKGGQIGGPTEGDSTVRTQNPRNGEVTPTEPARMGESEAEELVRGVAFAAFLRGLDFESHRFVQWKALQVCSRLEDHGSGELPMPIITDTGQWAIAEIRDDMPLVMKLETESLAFNCSPFFAGGGLQSLMVPAAPK